MNGWIDYSSSSANWDPDVDIAKSPLMPYLGKRNFQIWKCPADFVTVKNNKGQRVPRVRSNSMSQVFDEGYWLPAASWRIYAKLSVIVNPVKTWVLVDEHPDSNNDAACAVEMVKPDAMSGRIIDFPASYHNGACGFSFSDGHAIIHKWKGSTIRPPVRYVAPNVVSAGDSLPDVIWWSDNTTVAGP